MEAESFDLISLPASLLLNGQIINSLNHEEAAMNISDQGNALAVEVIEFLRLWFDKSETISMRTSGSTGQPKSITVTKSAMLQSAAMTVRFFQLKAGMNALLCLSPNYVAGKMMIVRAMVAGMNLITTDVSAHPVKNLEKDIDFAAMVPLQLTKSLEQSIEKLELIKKLIIGGSSISYQLETALQQLKVHVFHTYGMTETLSHIALRAVNGPDVSQSFLPLSGVKIACDERDCLTVEVPFLFDQKIVTNDLATIAPDGSFQITGRIDDVIISAGIKIHPAVIERKLASVVHHDFVISSVPDQTAGEIVLLVLAKKLSAVELIKLWQAMEEVLPASEMPRRIVHVDNIPVLSGGKTDRNGLKSLLAARSLIAEEQA